MKSPEQGAPGIVLGLVGGIGAGKSEVARCFAARGAEVFDADREAREILAAPRTAAAVEKDLGVRIRVAGRIDTRAIAKRVFGDPEALARLEARIHPEVRRRAERRIAVFRRDPSACILVLDVPLLLEAGFDDLCDAIALVEALRAVRLRRVRAERRWTAAEIARRERRQWPVARKRARARFRVRNAGSRRALEGEVERLIARLRADGAARSRSADAPAAGKGERNGKRKIEARSQAKAKEAGGARPGGAQGKAGPRGPRGPRGRPGVEAGARAR